MHVLLSLAFYMGSVDPNSDYLACGASALHTEHLPSPPFFSSVWDGGNYTFSYEEFKLLRPIYGCVL